MLLVRRHHALLGEQCCGREFPGLVTVETERFEEPGDDRRNGTVVDPAVSRDESAERGHQRAGDEVDGDRVVAVGEAAGPVPVGEIGPEVLLDGGVGRGRVLGEA